MKYIHVSLNKNRNLPGTLFLYGEYALVCYQFECFGKADSALAASAGNPEQNFLLRNGDACPGQYTAQLIIPNSLQRFDAVYLRSYGPYGIINLTPRLGLCMTAKANGRTELACHGGDLAANGINMRPTEGCIRVHNDTMHIIAGVIGPDGIEFNITEIQ
jgi:hypothetical protein